MTRCIIRMTVLMIMMMLHFRNAIISYVNHMLKRIHFAVSRARGWTLETFTLRFRKSCPFRCLRLICSVSFMWGGGVVKESPDGE